MKSNVSGSGGSLRFSSVIRSALNQEEMMKPKLSKTRYNTGTNIGWMNGLRRNFKGSSNASGVSVGVMAVDMVTKGCFETEHFINSLPLRSFKHS